MTNQKTGSSAGRVQIANDVLAKIASTAALESPGVFTMATGATGLVRKGTSRGVKVNVANDEVFLELNIVVRMGRQILETCQDVQQRTKTAIETMTGLGVNSVNVIVSGVAVEKEGNASGSAKNGAKAAKNQARPNE